LLIVIILLFISGKCAVCPGRTPEGTAKRNGTVSFTKNGGYMFFLQIPVGRRNRNAACGGSEALFPDIRFDGYIQSERIPLSFVLYRFFPQTEIAGVKMRLNLSNCCLFHSRSATAKKAAFLQP